MERELKQVIIVRQDLQLPKGKLAAQAAHASTMAMLRADWDTVREWEMAGMAKIVLKVPDEKTMVALFQQMKDQGLKPALVTDAGKTVVAPGTKTCVGVGPLDEKELDEFTGDLKLL